MIECNFMFEETIKEGKIFRKKNVTKKRCGLQIEVRGNEAAYSYYEDCDKENCILIKILKKGSYS